MKIDCGVVQGRMIGPIMFILFIIEMINSLNLVKFTIYVVATSLTFDTKNIEEIIPILNSELLKVSHRLRENHLSLNIKKNYVIFHKPRTVQSPNFPSVLIGNIASRRVYEARYLEVILDSRLEFS